MEEKILDIINKHNKAMTYDEILEKLTDEEIPLLPSTLSKLIKDLKIRFTNKGKYAKFDDKSQKIGVFAANKRGFGFVIVDGENKDYHVSYENVNGAIDGDEVVIKVIDESKHEAAVVRVNKRNLNNLLVGELYKKDDKNFLKLDDDKLNIIVEISPDGLEGAVPGHKIVVKIENKITKSNYYQGKVIRILGHKDDPGVDILSIAARYQINDVFPDEVIEELKSIPDEVSKEELASRKDLTGEVIFTIDGDDTKDIDDAISIKKLDNGNYLLGVHIADVSHYVKDGTALGDEAYLRGTSSYLANTVIPMLPHQLSNGICSLNPDVIRLTISCIMEIDDKGNLVDSEIFESYIKSRKQMTYKNVNKILNENIIPLGYDEFVSDLKLMEELSKIIRKNKTDKGYLDFDVPEPKIITDKNSEVFNEEQFAKIREKSEEIQKALIIEENDEEIKNSVVREESIENDKEISEIKKYTIDKPKEVANTQEENVFKKFAYNLNPEEKEIINVLLEKQDVESKIMQIAQSHNEMLEVIISNINDKALETIGDTVIESDMSSIYEDYEEEIKKGMKQIWQ